LKTLSYNSLNAGSINISKHWRSVLSSGINPLPLVDPLPSESKATLRSSPVPSASPLGDYPCT